MLGLPDSFESEGFDRAHMNLPENQNRLVAELVQPCTPIVAVLLPWREQVDSILLMYLGGQNSGSGEDDLSKMIDAMLEDMPPRQLAMLPRPGFLSRCKFWHRTCLI